MAVSQTQLHQTCSYDWPVRRVTPTFPWKSLRHPGRPTVAILDGARRDKAGSGRRPPFVEVTCLDGAESSCFPVLSLGARTRSQALSALFVGSATFAHHCRAGPPAVSIGRGAGRHPRRQGSGREGCSFPQPLRNVHVFPVDSRWVDGGLFRFFFGALLAEIARVPRLALICRAGRHFLPRDRIKQIPTTHSRLSRQRHIAGPLSSTKSRKPARQPGGSHHARKCLRRHPRSDSDPGNRR